MNTQRRGVTFFSPRGLAAVLLLFALPVYLRLSHVDHGMPRSYLPDTHMVRQALGMAKDGDLFPPVGRYSTYPYLVPYMLLPVYAGEYALGRAQGEWSGAEGFGTRVTLEPQLAQMPARILVALLGALTCWVTFRAARAAGLGTGAWVAAWLVATGLMHIQFSTHERPWIPMVFFAALAMWPAARYVRTPEWRWLALSGLAAGASAACHQAGLAATAVAFFAWLVAPLPWNRELDKRLLHGVGSALGFGLVWLIGNSFYLVHGPVEDSAIAGVAVASELTELVSVGGQAVRFGISLDSFRHLSHAFVGYDPAIVILGLAGLVPALRSRRTRAFALLAVAYAAFFMTNPNDHVRYLLPLTAFLALPAGVAAQHMWRHPLGRAAVVVLLALPLVQALRMGWVLQQEDTRALAERELAHLPEGARVAIDHYGPIVDLSRPALELLASLRPLRIREAKRLEFLEGGHLPEGGVDAISLDELTGLDHVTHVYGVQKYLLTHGETPAEILDWVGATHILLVDRRPGDGEPPWLADVARPAELVWTIAPNADPERTPREALLPTDLDFPLTGLWQVERPGPELALYALPSP